MCWTVGSRAAEGAVQLAGVSVQRFSSYAFQWPTGGTAMQFKWRALAALILLLTVFSPVAQAQQTSPDSMPGCIYNATPPTLSDRQTTVWQCDSNGRLITSGGSPAGVLNLASYLTSAQLTTAQAGVNTQDLTTQITAWLAACPATGCQYVVPPGYFYSATCNFNIINAFSMVGAGTRGLLGTQFVSVLVCGSTTARLLNISSKIGNFSNLAMLQNGGTAATGSSALWICTSGASTDCTTSVGSDNSPAISFDNVMIDGFYDTIDVGVAQSWHQVNSTVQNCVHWCYRVRNTVLADAGDWFITGNQIFPAGGADSAVRWESSGGGHINSNEVVNNTAGGINTCFSVETTPSSSVEIFIQDNKCESVNGPNIAVFSGWREMVITNNVVRLTTGSNVAFTGAIGAGTSTLTVTGAPGGTNLIYRGQVITGAGVPNGTYISSFGSGTGSNGTYTLNVTFQAAISAEAMTSSSPAILCNNCSELVIAGNVLTKLGTSAQAGAAAIMLSNVSAGATGSTTSGTVRTNNINNFTSGLMLSQSYGVSYDGNAGFTLANTPDATQLIAGSTSFVTDATTPVAGQPFTGGGKLYIPIYTDGSRWLAGTTILASNYIGPGDIVTSGWKVWYALRAFSAATAGTKAANICNAGDANCVDVNTLANGQLDMAAVMGSPLNCTGALDCDVKVWYNKAGANCITDTTCDMVQNTKANRYRLAFGPINNCSNQITSLGNQPCLFRPQTQFGRYQTVGTITIAQPWTATGAASRQGSFSAYNTLIVGGSGTGGLYYHLANGGDCFMAADKPFTVIDAQWQALMCVGDSAVGGNKSVANGVITNLAAGAGNFATAEVLSLFNDGNTLSDGLNGVGTEFGVASVAFSSTQIANINANMRAYYAF